MKKYRIALKTVMIYGLLFIGFNMSLNAQGGKLKKADKLFVQAEYAAAAKIYNQYVEELNDNGRTQLKIGRMLLSIKTVYRC